MPLHRTILISSIVAILSFAGLSIVAPRVEAQSAECDRVASPGEPNAAKTLIASLTPGQTGCLRSGTYVADEFSIATPGVRLTSYPGETATLRGRLRFEATADDAVVEGLTLDGRNPNNWLGPLIYADRVILRGNDISNNGTAICIHIDDFPGYPAPQGVLIEGNRVYDCGTSGTNQQHGIYVAQARDTVIRGNWIYGNADRGIQLYPNADGTLVTGNVIDGNGENVLFGGSTSSASDNNVVENNAISNSTIRYNVESSFPGVVGTGNIARNNCVWGGVYGGQSGGVQQGAAGFLGVANVVGEPLYAPAAAQDFDLAGSPCAGVAPQDAPGDGGNPTDSPGVVELSTSSSRPESGQRFTLRGTVQGSVKRGGRAVIEALRGGEWRNFASVRVSHNRFESRARAVSREMRLRATVPGVGQSKIVRVRVRA